MLSCTLRLYSLNSCHRNATFAAGYHNLTKWSARKRGVPSRPGTPANVLLGQMTPPNRRSVFGLATVSAGGGSDAPTPTCGTGTSPSGGTASRGRRCASRTSFSSPWCGATGGGTPDLPNRPTERPCNPWRVPSPSHRRYSPAFDLLRPPHRGPHPPKGPSHPRSGAHFPSSGHWQPLCLLRGRPLRNPPRCLRANGVPLLGPNCPTCRHGGYVGPRGERRPDPDSKVR